VAYPAQDDLLAVLQQLGRSGYTIALDDYDGRDDLGPLMSLCSIVRIDVSRVGLEALPAAIAAPKMQSALLVATDVPDHATFAACRDLGFTYFQGEYFAQPRLFRRSSVATAGLGSLRRLSELTAGDVSFEDLEQIISSDVGLSLKLLRYVNSAFFALPRTVETVREALTLLGTATVRRWATVMALVAASDAPEELVELALQRARMCEVLGGNRALDASDGHFTVGLFSVADALLGSSMEDVLETLPFSDEIRVALLRGEGPKGELLKTVVAYEQGEFPTGDGEVSLSSAYGESVTYAGNAVRAAA